MHGIFFEQKIEERLQHGFYCSVISAEIAVAAVRTDFSIMRLGYRA